MISRTPTKMYTEPLRVEPYHGGTDHGERRAARAESQETERREQQLCIDSRRATGEKARVGSMSEDQHMPKWALDPLLTESSPLQSGARSDGHGAVNNGGGGVDHEPDSEGDYDSEFSDEDMGRYSGVRTVRRGCLLDSLLLLNAITVLAALGVGVAQGLVLGYHKELSPESVAVRCYTILFCLLIIMAELEWTTTVREMFVLHSWIPRGVVYSFVGVLVLEEEDEKGLDLGGFSLYITVVAWIMVGIGALYFLLGICCVKRIRDKKAARHKTLVAHAEMQAALRRDHDSIA